MLETENLKVNCAALARIGSALQHSSMDPDAIHDSEAEHDHEDKGTAVTNEGQRNSRDRQHRNSHSNVLKNVGKNERGNSNDQQETKLILGEKCDEETG